MIEPHETNPTDEHSPPEVDHGALASPDGPRPKRSSGDWFPHTDTGNAERFAQMHGDKVRYVKAWEKWFLWSGVCWQEDDRGKIAQLAKRTVRSIYKLAANIKDDDRRRTLASWARKSESAQRLSAMLKLAQSEPPIAIAPSDLDSDPWLLNTLTGTLDLKTGELRKHDRADLLTVVAPVKYHHGADCPIFDSFLDRIMDGDGISINYLQCLAGMSITGDVTEHVMPICHGGGANGKSVLLDTLTMLLGDYAIVAPESLVTSSSNNEHPTEIARLKGKRLVIASETEENKRLRIAFVKRMTGDKILTGRFMRQDFFDFQRTHKTWLVTNNKPTVSETKHAIWRRLKLIPFRVTIPENERDPKLIDKLQAEWPGILAWVVRGCLEWQRSGLIEPDDVTIATDDYRTEQNNVAEFFEECCTTVNPDEKTTRHAVREKYVQWCRTMDYDPLPKTNLYERLRDIDGVDDDWATDANTKKRGRGFKGFSLLPGISRG